MAPTHDFDARVLIPEGEITITYTSGPVIYKVGDHRDVAAGTQHAENAGPNGVRFLADRRAPA